MSLLTKKVNVPDLIKEPQFTLSQSVNYVKAHTGFSTALFNLMPQKLTVNGDVKK